MTKIEAKPRNMEVIGTTTFHLALDILSHEDQIRSLACGAAINDYDYLMVFDPTGKERTFWFDFAPLRKVISENSIMNVVLRTIDDDGTVHQNKFSTRAFPNPDQSAITNLSALQRTDGSMLVDIFYDLISGYEVDPSLVKLLVSTDDGLTYVEVGATGDIGEGVPTGTQRHITLDATGLIENEVIRVKVSAYSYRMRSEAISEASSVPLVAPQGTPVISLVSPLERDRYGIEDGGLFKGLSIDFFPIDSSSSSSSSVSSVSSTSSSSSSLSSISSVSSVSSISSQSSASSTSSSSSFCNAPCGGNQITFSGGADDGLDVWKNAAYIGRDHVNCVSVAEGDTITVKNYDIGPPTGGCWWNAGHFCLTVSFNGKSWHVVYEGTYSYYYGGGGGGVEVVTGTATPPWVVSDYPALIASIQIQSGIPVFTDTNRFAGTREISEVL